MREIDAAAHRQSLGAARIGRGRPRRDRRRRARCRGTATRYRLRDSGNRALLAHDRRAERGRRSVAARMEPPRHRPPRRRAAWDGRPRSVALSQTVSQPALRRRGAAHRRGASYCGAAARAADGRAVRRGRCRRARHLAARARPHRARAKNDDDLRDARRRRSLPPRRPRGGDARRAHRASRAPPEGLFDNPATDYVRDIVHAGDEVYRRYYLHARELLRQSSS